MVTRESQFLVDPYTSRPQYGVYRESARDLPILGEVDVLVVGGSPSGCAAAICAARGFAGKLGARGQVSHRPCGFVISTGTV